MSGANASLGETGVFAYRSGQIALGRKCPRGALELIRGDVKTVTAIVKGVARLAYDNKTWLVPGIPEALRREGSRHTPFAALSRAACGLLALLAFKAQLSVRLSRFRADAGEAAA